MALRVGTTCGQRTNDRSAWCAAAGWVLLLWTPRSYDLLRELSSTPLLPNRFSVMTVEAIHSAAWAVLAGLWVRSRRPWCYTALVISFVMWSILWCALEVHDQTTFVTHLDFALEAELSRSLRCGQVWFLAFSSGATSLCLMVSRLERRNPSPPLATHEEITQ